MSVVMMTKALNKCSNWLDDFTIYQRCESDGAGNSKRTTEIINAPHEGEHLRKCTPGERLSGRHIRTKTDEKANGIGECIEHSVGNNGSYSIIAKRAGFGGLVGGEDGLETRQRGEGRRRGRRRVG